MPGILKLTIPAIFLFLSIAVVASTPPAVESSQRETLETGTQEAPEQIPQRGFVDSGRLLNGKVENWKGVVDTLSGLGFNYIATTNGQADAAVAEYLAKKGLATRTIKLQDEAREETGDHPSILVIGEKSQKLWNSGQLTPAEGSELLWADDGSGKLEGGPFDKKGHDFGVFLHAGSPYNGPVQDPYPALISDSIKLAMKRGLTANVLIAAPDSNIFNLNLEAAAAAMKQAGKFDGGDFYLDWTTRNFGSKASGKTVKSLKLLHGAHANIRGFLGISERTAEIVAGLAQDKPVKVDLKPLNDALRLSRRSLELAREAAEKVPADKAGEFESKILFPAEIFIQNLELLESLSQLSSAWKIYRMVPPSDISRQRVTGLLAEAGSKAENLQNTLANRPEVAGFQNRDNWVPKAETIEALTNKL